MKENFFREIIRLEFSGISNLGGELIDAYNQGGQVEVEKLIREQFGVLLYGDGKGQTINRAEYLRWKFRDQTQV